MQENDFLGKYLILVGSIIFAITISAIVLALSSCQYLPQLATAVDDIATDDAITIQIDRDAIQKETDVHITVDVVNKVPPKQ